MTNRLTRIEIDAFRGFNEPRSFDIDADFVLVSGGNGVGKTSLVDAIAWALTGTMPHLKGRKRRQNDEVVVNAYRAGELARVSLGLRVDGGGALQVLRTGNTARSSLQLDGSGRRKTGDAAEIELARRLGYGAPSELRTAIETWAILRQDEIRAVLDASPDEIHRRLRDLLGLAVLDEFEDDAEADYKGRARLAAEARETLNQARSEVTRLRADLEAVDRSLNAGQAPVSARVELERVAANHRRLVQVDIPAQPQVDEVRVLLADLRTLYSEASRIRSSLTEIDQRLLSLPTATSSADELAAQRMARAQRLHEALEARSAAANALDEARRTANQRSALAAAALPLLGDRCPVCQQAIDRSAVAEALTETADAQQAEAIVAAERRLSESTTALTAVQAASAAEEAAERETLRRLDERTQLVDQRRQLASNLGSWKSGRLTVTGAVAHLADLISAATELGLAARQLVSTLEAADAANRRPDLAARHSAAVARATDAARELDRVDELVREADAVRRAARDASVEVTTSALRSLNPHFGQVYRRIDPHPTFTDLGLSHEVYRSKGRTLPVLIDPVAHVEANPGVICSIGQLNIVALSYFLALALLIDDSRLPFAIFDDPLQSLDDDNVLGFADLCRHLRRSRQLIVTTHEARYAQLLERKMAPREGQHQTIAIEFTSWDRSGPSVEQRVVAEQEIRHLLTA